MHSSVQITLEILVIIFELVIIIFPKLVINIWKLSYEFVRIDPNSPTLMSSILDSPITLYVIRLTGILMLFQEISYLNLYFFK